ncbi:MAG: aminotransferase class V-fold PLP-dependent enzyme, partial [Methanothrix sp.]|nr:aminotransferase class V-fold PLP-dependent enzyme [Methanothrix sp.]
KLIMIDHFDYQFANEHDVYGIGKVAKDYGIPFLYNGAYTVGVMPVDGRKIGADFIVGSGHKSMASAAPSGVLATTDEWAPKLFSAGKGANCSLGRRGPKVQLLHGAILAHSGIKGLEPMASQAHTYQGGYHGKL